MPDMIKDPFTGKMVPKPERRKVDLVTPQKLPEEVTNTEYNVTLAKLKELRQQFAALQPGQRAGKKGDSLMAAYRHESLKLMHLSGEKAPPIYGDM